MKKSSVMKNLSFPCLPRHAEFQPPFIKSSTFLYHKNYSTAVINATFLLSKISICRHVEKTQEISSLEYFTFVRLDCEKLRRSLGEVSRKLSNTLLKNVVDTYRHTYTHTHISEQTFDLTADIS